MRYIFGEKDQEGEKLEEQLFLAEKVGIMQNEAFLEIWNRCSKTSKKDYEMLIATEDFSVIQEEIERKFKKSSLRYH